ncbi:MAG: amino acid ABC transporter permease [Micromonosporaceae bacterium]
MSSVASWPEWIGLLLPGLQTSVLLTVAMLAMGLPLGLLLALGASATRFPPLQWVTLAVVEMGRGVPVLVIIYLVYFGLPQVDITIGAFAAGSVALAVSFGAYTSEVFRAGLAAVPAGQHDAAQALGLRPRKVLRLVILPQAIRIVTPPILGWTIIFFQATSLCYAIAVPELLSRAYTLATNTFEYFGVLLLAAVLYAAICIPASQFVARIERRRARGR